MNKSNDDTVWKKRMQELEEKNKYFKLKRNEKLELKSLHKKNSEIYMKIKKEEEEKKRKEEEEKKRKEEEKKRKEEEKKRKEEEEKNLEENPELAIKGKYNRCIKIFISKI